MSLAKQVTTKLKNIQESLAQRLIRRTSSIEEANSKVQDKLELASTALKTLEGTKVTWKYENNNRGIRVINTPSKKLEMHVNYDPDEDFFILRLVDTVALRFENQAAINKFLKSNGISEIPKDILTELMY